LLGCDSHLPVSRLVHSAAARDAGAAAELAASRKEVKYAGLDGRYMFALIAFENLSTKRFNSPAPFLPWPKIDISGESRETSYLFQRCSVLVYSELTMFCCMTVCQIVTTQITTHTQLFVDFPNF